MELIDGKLVSEAIKQEIAQKVADRISQGKKAPHLAAILVGENGASITYVNSKIKSCEQVGMKSSLVRLPADITEQTLLAEIQKLNEDADVDGFIVQLPLPAHIDEQRVLEAVDPAKDVDGFHPVNQGRLMLDLPCFLPATPYGIIQLLERYGIDTQGKKCVVVGRSNIVGKPISMLMARNNAKVGNCTVVMTHSRTKNLKEETLQADILIAALGKAEFIKADMVKEGAVVVDVGITRVADPSKKSGFAIKGDVDFGQVAPKCSYITPVPGGVGLMTVVSLLMNTLQAAGMRGV